MKRKISAILAADIAGYSRLVAEDEEETLRRLSSYRAVFEDFVSRFSGRIFNTAGDAVLAEFSSAVEAVRCAIDIQESVRTRNLAYPTSRQMNFRIGITVGDVVERDGDLLGDGVNIAARLESLAQPGGVCISRTVFEQVSNKLSVGFVDIGEQTVKNIPTPVHAYVLSLVSDEGNTSKLATRLPIGAWPLAALAVSVTVLVIAAVLYVFAFRFWEEAENAGPRMVASTLEDVRPRLSNHHGEPLVPEDIPFIPDRQRTIIATEYMSAPDHKAIALSLLRSTFISDQKDDDTAKTAALADCQQATDAAAHGSGPPCEVYAVGTTVVSNRGRPPMPPQPWLVRDPSIEAPFTAKDVPLVNENFRGILEKFYVPGQTPKAVALGPAGGGVMYYTQTSSDEAIRRSLEACGARTGVPCLIVAVDDVFVVPIPTTMKVVGLFHPLTNGAIAHEAREDVARRIGNATSGWNAVAAGADGLPGVKLKAANEPEAIDGALAECGKRDHGCRVIALGPFAVEAK